MEDLADLRALAELDVTYAQGFALSRPGAAWPVLEPGVAAAAADRLEMGVRVTGHRPAGAWSHGLAELADRLALVCDEASWSAPGGAPPSCWAPTRSPDAGHRRRGALVELLSFSPLFRPGGIWPLADFPATAHLLATGCPGQVVAGDAHVDRAELEELEQLGFGAMLMVPMPLSVGRLALMEVYRVCPQAFFRAEIERARVVALQLRAVLDRLAGP